MTQALAGKKEERKAPIVVIRDLFEKNKSALEAALPKHIGVERFLRVALTTVQRTPRLVDPKTDPRSLLAALVESAQLGLMVDSVLGEGYLVPYWNKNRGCYEVQFQPGYKGYISLARRSGQVSNIFARVVYELEKCKVVYGDTPKILHVPLPPGQRGVKVIGGYAVVVMKDKTRQTEWMWEDEIMGIRARSKSGQEGPWVTDTDEMRKKTVIRRLAKILPLSPEWSRAAALDEAREAGIRVVPEVDFGQELELDTGGYSILDDPEAQAKPELTSGSSPPKEEKKPEPEKTTPLSRGDSRVEKPEEAGEQPPVMLGVDVSKMKPGELLNRTHDLIREYAKRNSLNPQDAIEDLKALAGLKPKGAMTAASIRKLHDTAEEALKVPEVNPEEDLPFEEEGETG